jgi:hypothetical protein
MQRARVRERDRSCCKGYDAGDSGIDETVRANMRRGGQEQRRRPRRRMETQYNDIDLTALKLMRCASAAEDGTDDIEELLFVWCIALRNADWAT